MGGGGVLSSKVPLATQETLDLDRVQDMFRQVRQVASTFMPKKQGGGRTSQKNLTTYWHIRICKLDCVISHSCTHTRTHAHAKLY